MIYCKNQAKFQKKIDLVVYLFIKQIMLAIGYVGTQKEGYTWCILPEDIVLISLKLSLSTLQMHVFVSFP